MKHKEEYPHNIDYYLFWFWVDKIKQFRNKRGDEKDGKEESR